jgi:hypothetical protein
MKLFDTTIQFESSDFTPTGVWEEYQITKMARDMPNRVLTEYEDVPFTPKARYVTTEDPSATTTGPYAGSGEIDPSPVTEEAGKDRNASGGEATNKNALMSKFDSVKKGAGDFKKDFMENPTTKKAIEATKKMAIKVQDFTKSSVAKINALPETTQAKMINENILDAKEEPRSLADNLKKGVKSAGKGLAVAGLAITSLPLAAAAIVANKAIDKSTKQNAAEEMQHELIRLDGQIQAADQAGDYDKKADLLIAKRTAQQAYAKLKYGLKTRLSKVIE